MTEACKSCGSADEFPFGELVECQVCGGDFCGKCLHGGTNDSLGRRFIADLIVCGECNSVRGDFDAQIAKVVLECEERINQIIRLWSDAAFVAGVWKDG
jgi:hypothetical protein